MVIKLDETIGGQIQCLSSDQIIPFQFNEIMKDNFRISQGDLLEFSLTLRPNNGVRRRSPFPTSILLSLCRFD